MPEERAVHLISTNLGNYEFQIWQRKNDVLTEPFATAIFVRKSGAPWTAYLLDIQDTYRPAISLRKDDSGVAVLYDDKFRRAYFDEKHGIFTLDHYDGQSDAINGTVIDSEPPDDWWQRRLGETK
jgi:hypothetical protein